ncbi:hypothetical protein, partial [Clavibacter michiganensis]|uniref:hypothetical protein n=1 Tax=Clavibacter michiganensis TaxID=28447 RepID=UPI002930CE1E
MDRRSDANHGIQAEQQARLVGRDSHGQTGVLAARAEGGAATSLAATSSRDGGGGTRGDMMWRQGRPADLEGAPEAVVAHPDEFFRKDEAEYPDAPVWVVELYLVL